MGFGAGIGIGAMVAAVAVGRLVVRSRLTERWKRTVLRRNSNSKS